MVIRGVAALYYAGFGIDTAANAIRSLLPIVLDTIVLSVFLHGSTAGMRLNYLARGKRRALQTA